MLKQLLAGSLLCLALLVAITACGGSTPGHAGNSPAAPNEVHMGGDNFEQTSVTLQKGQSLILVNESGAPHYIANGTWKNNSPDTHEEAGAPTVANVLIDGNATQSIGPFSTAGTFHLYCTVHPGMNLTVLVQ
jgi:plastocyanin